MKIIIKPNLLIEEQSYQADRPWVLSKYCEVVQYNEHYCIYNSLVGSLVILTEEEYSKLFTPKGRNFLIKYWFIVPEGTDMVTIANSVRDKLVNPEAKKGKTNAFVIVTSTACNARCWYCFECGIASKTMSIETAEDVAKDNNFDPEHVKNWVEDYKKLAIEYALNADKPQMGVLYPHTQLDKLKFGGVPPLSFSHQRVR